MVGAGTLAGKAPPMLTVVPEVPAESAQRRWRMVNAPHLVALARAGAAFVNGKLVERPEDEAPPEAALKILITGIGK